MKYCGKCGKQLQDEAKFCSGCGAPVPVPVPREDSSGAWREDAEPRSSETISLEAQDYTESYTEPLPADQSMAAEPEMAPTIALEQPWEEAAQYSAASSSIDQPIKKAMSKTTRKILIGSLLAVVLVAGGFLGWKNFGTAAREQAKLDLAVKYLSENNYDKAILAFNDAIEIDSREVKAYEGLARVYTLQGKYDDAKSVYDRGMAAVDPDKQQALLLAVAGMYIDQGELDDAEKAFRDIKDRNAGCLEAYFGLEMVYEQRGDIASAEEILREAISRNPKEHRAYNALALFLTRNDKADEAFDNLVKSLALEINQQDAYSILTDMYKGDWSELRSKAAGVNDGQVSSMLEFYSYYAARDYQPAVNIYIDKLAKETGNQKAQVLAAIAMTKLNDKTAAEIINQLLDEELNEWILADIASYYLEAGDKDKAREYALKSIEADGTNLDAIVVLQEVNNSDGDVKLYTVRVLVFNWRPVGLLMDDIRARSLPVLGEVRNVDNIFDEIGESPNVKMTINQIDNQQFPIMKLYVSVLDRDNESIDNIPLNYFVIREKLLNSNTFISQKVKSVSQLKKSTALSIDLVMDTSDSMSENSKLENAQENATNFINMVNGADELGIVEFNSYVRTKTEFTKNTNELEDAISQLYTSGQTALYDALYTALVQTSQKDGAKCIIAFTDGMSNCDTRSKQEVIDLAKKTGIPIYTIGIGDDVQEDVLNDIAAQTGGYYVSTPSAADLENIYQNIFKVQKKQYLLTYTSNNTEQDKQWRNIEVGVYGAKYKGMSAKDYTSEVVKPTLAPFDMKKIDKIIKDEAGDGDYSIIIKDLSNGQQSKTGKYDKKMPASALINVPITLAIADMIKQGEVTLDTRIPYHYTVGGRRKFTQADDGQMFTIGELLQAMLNYSDNNCTNSLLDYIGIDRVNHIVHSYGCTDTNIVHPLLDKETNTENLTTCSDVERMLELLYSDSLPIGSVYMNENFKIVDETKTVGALKYLPENVFALHHNAMTSTKYNETAYIGTGSKKYIITVMSCNGKQEELEETTAQISKYVYDQMLK